MPAILRFNDLRRKGVCGSRMTLHRLRKEDLTFPVGVAIGGGIGWFEAEIDEWLAARPRIKKREQQTTPPASRQLAEAV